MSDLEEYVEHFRARVVQDAMAEATSSYWLRRAADFEWARPRESDFRGRASSEELNARWERDTAIATACRNRAAISLLLDGDGNDRSCCIATAEEQADLERLSRAFRDLAQPWGVAS